MILNSVRLLGRRWRKLRHTGQIGQGLVEFALVIMLIMVTMAGGVIVIRALLLQQQIIDIVARASQWGAMTNSNDEVERILKETCDLVSGGCANPDTCTFEQGQCTANVQLKFDPPDPKNRPIGTRFTVTVTAQVPMLGPGIALVAQMGARSTVIIEHDAMRFVPPEPPAFTFHYGDYVLVTTTAHDTLNVRRKPGLKGDIYFIIPNGGHATIIGGPVYANGLRWWQIYYARAKLTGWCVDQADTVQTLKLVTQFF